MLIGILALQGDYLLHANLLNDNNINNILIKNPDHLSKIDGLIIPGGESTVILKLLYEYGFNEELKKFNKNKYIYGTCAGAIIMSHSTEDDMNTFDFINVKSYRNFWGRQIHSFTDKIDLTFTKYKFDAHFIRAPKFECLSRDLQILSIYDSKPILIRNNKHLISSFHPEMTNNFVIHEYFIDMINGKV